MTPELQSGLIGAGSAILAGAVGAMATYKAALVGFRAKQARTRLLAAFQDLEFFRALEAHYLQQLVKVGGETPATRQREARDAVRIKLRRDLHPISEPKRLRTAIHWLSTE